MSELCLSSTGKTKFSSLLISDLILLSSFVLSHPLYFLYIIFFSPYLLKVLSFLSPLFITTTLLFITLLTTISPGLVNDRFSTTSSIRKVSFLQIAYHAVLAKLQPRIQNEGEESHSLEALELYKIVFDTSMIDVKEYQVDNSQENPEERILQTVESSVMKISNHDQDCSVLTGEALTIASEEDSVNCDNKLETIQSVKQESRFEDSLKQLDEFERVKSVVEEMKVEPPGRKVNKEVEKQKEESFVLNGYEATCNDRICNAKVQVANDIYNRREYTSKIKAHPQRERANIDRKDNGRDYPSKEESSRSMEYDLGSYGSMKREKEWRRTLACKLFEERNNFDGIEGMDSLWETYEMDSTKATNSKTGTRKKDKPKTKIEYYGDDDDDDDDEEGDEIVGQVCCLQAFKFSAGKMNLGVGKRNLARISKAVKGFGWLHRVSRHGKKVHNGDTFRFV